MSQDNSKQESSELESNAQVESVGKPKRKEGNTSGSCPRFRVRIRSYRVRILDLDNLYGGVKYFVDSLRYAEIIPDDDPESITLQVSQEKVKNYSKEKTEVEVECV